LAPFAVVALFLFTNITGILFSRALAQIAIANSPDAIVIPADIPTSETESRSIIFRTGERRRSRFVRGRGKVKISDYRSVACWQGLMQLMPETAKRFVVLIERSG
jgi:hypothetical protein